MSNASKNTLVLALMFFLLLNGGMLYYRYFMLGPELGKMDKNIQTSENSLQDLKREMKGLIALEGRPGRD